jgi:SAM-dependent methyltransferase
MGRVAAGVENALFRVLPPGRFQLNGHDHRYLWHRESQTWRSERAVELPIALAAISEADKALEVGNVLGRYRPRMHEVVDKHERAPDVINEDVLSFVGGPYDLIVSVSTIKHIGYDETPRDPTKAARAVEHLRGLLAPRGTLLATNPIGYNRDFDDYVFASGADVECLRRVGPRTWKQVGTDEARVPYGWPYPAANAVAIARWPSP